jgi:hypothetical protein
MKKISMKDVPLKVKKDIREKWGHGLETGWDDELWDVCSLCHYVVQRMDKSGWRVNIFGEIKCNLCPLYQDWCGYTAKNSKIHMYWNFDPDVSRYELRMKWKIRIEKFLSYIDSEIKEHEGRNQARRLARKSRKHL